MRRVGMARNKCASRMQMATAKPHTFHSRRRKLRRALLLVVLLAIAGLAWIWRPLAADAVTAAAYGARLACPCRFIAGRALADCRRDLQPGMALVLLSEDVETRSVTAWVPLLASQTATFREGEGCRLGRWED